MKLTRHFLLATVLVTTALAVGCMTRATHKSTSVVEYLYPDKKDPVDTPSIPRLSLPIRVGIAFVPESSAAYGHLTEKDKADLMNEISSHFRKYDFVKTIEVIPSAYLRPKGGFANLVQVRTMFGTDVIALVSYDQTQFTDEGWTSITYWTLVGAYLVPGEKNDTNTMMDAAVYDIASRKLLFRAPGVSYIKSRATPVNLSEQLRADSTEGFKDASKELVANLDQQLQLFREKVKASPQDYQVVARPGYTGGGSLDFFYLIAVAALLGAGVWSRFAKKE